ncbi:MAG: glycosyltransferase [Candidatus Aminicenantes bacterium]|nr:MAG: glycosyltransferase [Candidatus Aminicenantes bacterium]
MKIGIISSYLPIHCGIATYSSYLIEELRRLKNRVYIVCHKGGKGLDCYPAFNYDDPDLPHKAFRTMMKLAPDLVHIQHEYALFGEQRGMNVIPLAYKFKLSQIPTVITLHTIPKKRNYEEKIIEKVLVEITDATIVHEQYQRELIIGRVGYQDKIWVIPHGARQIKPASNAKEKLGLMDKKVVLLAGYFRRSKNFERVVRIFPKVAEAVDDAFLLIASGVRKPEDITYRDEFLEFVANSRAKNKIKVLLGPFSKQKFDLILSSADVAVLPYLKGAQSGIMAHCLAFAKPIVVSSDVQAMADLVQKTRSGLVARTNSELAEAIITILTDKNLAKEFSDNARRHVKKRVSWQIIASRHMDVYNKILKNRLSSRGICN